MAFPRIVATATTNGTSASQTPTVNLPSNIHPGDLLFCVMRSADANSYAFPSGWVELVDASPDSSVDGSAIAYKVADGSEVTSMVVTLSTNSAKFAAIVHRITGADDPTTNPPSISTVAIGVDDQPNPTACTPSEGLDQYLWLWCGTWEGEQTSPPASNPTNFALYVTGADSGTAGVDTTNCRVATAARESKAATMDPGVWALSAAGSWAAYTVAIPPDPTWDPELVCYVWVIDGVPTLFTTQEIDASWAVAQGFVSCYPGLREPAGMTCGIDLRTGDFDQSTTTIDVDDVDGTMPALFGGVLDDADDLSETYGGTLIPSATAPAALYSKHVGHEAIGSAGERHRYSCVPGFNVGMLHYGSISAQALGLSNTPVSDTPILWPGRRCAVYRVKKTEGVWADLADSDRVWFGSMLGSGQQDAGRWRFMCEGPESWVGGNLGAGTWEDALPVEPAIVIDGDALKVVGELVLINMQTNEIHHTWVDNHNDVTALIGAANYSDVVAAIQSILSDIETDATSGFAYTDHGTSQLAYATEAGDDGVIIQFDRDAADTDLGPLSGPWTAVLILAMHEKVWAALGYDPKVQNSDRDPVANFDQYGVMDVIGDENGSRYQGQFFAVSPEGMKSWEEGMNDLLETETPWCNNQAPRRWPPIYPGGAVSWTGYPGQEFEIRTSNDVHMLATYSRAVMGALDDDDGLTPFSLGDSVGNCNSQGLMVFDGPYRRHDDGDNPDPVQGAFLIERERREGRTIQVARVSWKTTADLRVSTAATSTYPRLVIMAWLDPRMFGFDYSKFEGVWGAWRDAPDGSIGLTCRPLTSLEYHGYAKGDRLDLVMMRTLATTGTATGWYQTAGYVDQIYGLNPPAAYLDAGVNDLATGTPTDAEVAELGLRVPSTMIQPAADWLAALSELGPHLERCKVAFSGSASCRAVFRSLLAPAGLCWSLSGGKFGIFDPWRFPTPNNAATITKEKYAGKPGKPEGSIPKQSFRVFSPIDRIDVNARIEPVAKTYFRKYERRSTDMGSRYRSQTITYAVSGDHLIHPLIQGCIGANWPTDLAARWQKGFVFWGVQHFKVDLRMLSTEDDGAALDLWPGDGILLSDEWLADPSGNYGISIAPGYVVSRSFDANDEIVRLTCIVNAETAYRMYSPAAVVTRYDDGDDTPGVYRLICEDDWFGIRSGTTVDATGFAEPEWSAVGGTAKIEVWAYDGAAWTRGIFGAVATVEGSIITLTGALTGATWYRDQHHVVVLREWGQQTANEWVREWFAPICLEDGTTGGAAGIKFRA